jgi:hypothetical protein
MHAESGRFLTYFGRLRSIWPRMLDRLSLSACQRPVFDRLRRRQRAQEIPEIVSQRMKLGAAALRAVVDFKVENTLRVRRAMNGKVRPGRPVRIIGTCISFFASWPGLTRLSTRQRKDARPRESGRPAQRPGMTLPTPHAEEGAQRPSRNMRAAMRSSTRQPSFNKPFRKTFYKCNEPWLARVPRISRFHNLFSTNLS